MNKITIKYFSGIYQLRVEQNLNCSIAEAWDFFSHPKNLDKITPPDMNFKITSSTAENTYAGQIITYRIGILPFINSYWITEITQVEERKFFIDEQRFGSYRMWHHEHHFFENSDGTVKMTDIVSYKLPFGFLGRILAGKIIKNKVVAIFDHRRKVLENLFKN